MASNTTQDHDFIREWADKRGGKPSEVASTEQDGKPGILRLEFPDAPNANDDALKEIGWDEFFEKFDASGLEFLYQEETAGGEQSNFNKLVYPEPDSPSGKRLLRKSAGKKSAGKKGASRKGAVKVAPKKAATKKTAAKKGAAKVATKKSPGKKVAAKKIVAKKSPGKKVAAKKTPSKKIAGKKVAAKKTSAKKTAAKKTAVKKAAGKKSTR